MRVRAPLVPLEMKWHWSFSGQDSAPVMRRRGFESHPVLSVLRQFGFGAVCPCCSGSLLPCQGGSAGSTPAGHFGWFRDVGKPGLIRLLREQEIAGSNPAIPTWNHGSNRNPICLWDRNENGVNPEVSLLGPTLGQAPSATSAERLIRRFLARSVTRLSKPCSRLTETRLNP